MRVSKMGWGVQNETYDNCEYEYAIMCALVSYTLKKNVYINLH